MADVSGLVIGAVALASLFTTCIELFEYFELGRNYAYDHQLAITKLTLLKARLAGWGLSLNVRSPGHEDSGLRKSWPSERDVVGRSLFGIKDIFENASLLVDKYKLTPRRTRTFRLVPPLGSDALLPLTTDPRVRTATSSNWLHLRKRTKWAIHDKQKFDRFIDDLSFLIENLEKVNDRIGMSNDPAANIKVSRSPRTSQLSLRQTQDSSTTLIPTSHTTSSLERRDQRSYEMDRKSGQAFDASKLACATNASFYTGNQSNDNSMGIMGNTDQSTRNAVYSGSQTNTNNAIGVMGNTTAEAAANLYRTGTWSSTSSN